MENPVKTVYTADGREICNDPSGLGFSTKPVVRHGVISEEAVFGAGSRLELKTTGIPVEESNGYRVAEYMMNGMVLSLFFFYLIVIYKYREYLFETLKAFLVPRYIHSIVDEQSVSFRYFLTVTNGMGLLALTALAAKSVFLWNPDAIGTYTPEPWVRQFFILLLAGAIVSIVVYRRIIVKIIGKISLRSDLMEKITLFNRIIFTANAIFLTPIALIVSLWQPGSIPNMMSGIGILLILLVFYYLFKSFSFFVQRKISILQWFLYLCGIEIWPISFYVLLALRDFKL